MNADFMALRPLYLLTTKAQRAQSVDYTILYYQVREFAFCEPSCFLLRFSCLYNV